MRKQLNLENFTATLINEMVLELNSIGIPDDNSSIPTKILCEVTREVIHEIEKELLK